MRIVWEMAGRKEGASRNWAQREFAMSGRVEPGRAREAGESLKESAYSCFPNLMRMWMSLGVVESGAGPGQTYRCVNKGHTDVCHTDVCHTKA